MILLLHGNDAHDPLFLQIKEAGTSVLADYCDPSVYDNAGQRVVEGQRLMQSTSDIFLGWTRTGGYDFYWRQLRDWKGSVNIEKANKRRLHSYAALCGFTLALAHARSGDSIALAAYLGKANNFERAVGRFATAYANQVEKDYLQFIRHIQLRDTGTRPATSRHASPNPG